MNAKRKKTIVGVLAVVIGLPVAFIAVAVAWFRMEGKTNGAIVTSGDHCSSACTQRRYVRQLKWKSADGTIWPMSTVFLSFTRREVRFQESGRWDRVVWDGTSGSSPI